MNPAIEGGGPAPELDDSWFDWTPRRRSDRPEPLLFQRSGRDARAPGEDEPARPASIDPALDAWFRS
jgi:hypothetical protein